MTDAQVTTPVKKSRQVLRAQARRSGRPEPGPVELTSRRWLARRTKGQPYGRVTLVDVTPGRRGVPAVFHVDHPTRRTARRTLVATPSLVDVFFPSVPDGLRASLLGH